MSPTTPAALLAAMSAALAGGLAVAMVPSTPAGRRGSARRAARGPSSSGPPRPAAPVVVAACVALLPFLLLPVPVAVPASVVAAAWSHRLASRAESAADRRARRAVERELPRVVDLLESLLRSGASPQVALGEVVAVVGPDTAAALGGPVRRLRLGDDPVAVWESLERHPTLGRLGTSLRRAAVTGAPVAEALGRLGDDLRAVLRAGADERLRAVEVRATVPLALCLLPGLVVLGVVPLVVGTVGRLAV